jgi:hypothetical protein
MSSSDSRGYFASRGSCYHHQACSPKRKSRQIEIGDDVIIQGTLAPAPTLPPHSTRRRTAMKSLYALAMVAALSTPSFAAETMSSLPSDGWTITNYYK